MNDVQKVALVTGGARGIGAAVARRLCHEGFHVVVNYRSSVAEAEALVADVRAAGGSAEARRADVCDLTQTRALMEHIASTRARLDVLVNNAGRSEDGFLLLTPTDRWWAVFHENLSPVVNCSRAALPLMLRHGGAIVNITSVSGIRGVDGQTAYGAAKAAIAGFSRALAKEVSAKGVVVNCVAPGPIATEMYDQVPEERRRARLAMLPLQRVGRPEEVADVVAMLALGRAGFLVGQVIAIDGGATI